MVLTHLVFALSRTELPGNNGGPWEFCAHGPSRILHISGVARKIETRIILNLVSSHTSQQHDSLNPSSKTKLLKSSGWRPQSTNPNVMWLYRSHGLKVGLPSLYRHQGEGQLASGAVTHTLPTVLSLVLTTQEGVNVCLWSYVYWKRSGKRINLFLIHSIYRYWLLTVCQAQTANV